MNNCFGPLIYAGEFDDVLDSRSSDSVSDPSEEICLEYHRVRRSPVLDSNGSMTKDSCKKLLDIENLTLQTPSKATLVKDLKLMVNEKDHLLVSDLFLSCLMVYELNIHKCVEAEEIFWSVIMLTGNRT